MKCVICKNGETRSGNTTVTFERNGMIIVFKDVPAAICANCGESYVDGKVSAILMRKATEAADAGVQVDVRNFLEQGPVG